MIFSCFPSFTVSPSWLYGTKIKSNDITSVDSLNVTLACFNTSSTMNFAAPCGAERANKYSSTAFDMNIFM